MGYSNELLEEKWKAQEKLAKMAEEKGMDYCDFIHQYVEELDRKRGLKPKIAKGLEKAKLNRDVLKKAFRP